ncbi:hypothetical protein QVD17_00533 [Tagetes erecta]|uniref:Uncharacterized protein n=1 Tax=Tagetes erecta TaxID=13708 RepID=A0AAD8L8Y7_TARER|nr:hypothetical protein QVD17_00533 [Tagetes erecta]
MATSKGSDGYNHSGSESAAMIGYISSGKTSVSGEGSYQSTSRFSYVDKQSGCYSNVTNKEKASAGDFQWKNGTTGTRNEYKESSTFRFGDKNGYTEVYNEQKVRNVTYDKSNCTSNNYIAYDNEHGPYDGYGNGNDGGEFDEGGSYGGYGYHEDHGSYGRCDYNNENYGSYGGYGYGYGYDSD